MTLDNSLPEKNKRRQRQFATLKKIRKFWDKNPQTQIIKSLKYKEPKHKKRMWDEFLEAEEDNIKINSKNQK